MASNLCCVLLTLSHLPLNSSTVEEEQKKSWILNSYDDIWGCSAHTLSLLLLWETRHFTSWIKALLVRPQTVTRVLKVQ